DSWHGRGVQKIRLDRCSRMAFVRRCPFEGTREISMKLASLLRGTAVGALSLFAAGTIFPGAANADIVLVNATTNAPTTSVADSFTDVGAQGFGNFRRLLTVQGSGSQDELIGSATPVNVANGDATPGANKTNTPTVATLGWTSGALVGIGFNSDQSGGTGITMNDLKLTLFNGTTAVGSFDLASSLKPLLFDATQLARQPGNGNAVFAFGLTAAEQAQFNTLVGTFGTGLLAGLSTDLGCAAGAPSGCQVTN